VSYRPGLPCPHCGLEVFVVRASDPPPESLVHLKAGSFKHRFGLAKREWEIADLVASGLTNKQAAERIGLTEQVVKNYVCAIYRKIGISKRSQLVLVCLGLLNPRMPR